MRFPHLLTAVLSLAVSALAPAAAQQTAARENTYPQLLAVGDESRIAPVDPEKQICFALYTVHDGVLKLSAHLYPLVEDDEHQVQLDIRRNGGEWEQVAEAEVHPVGWTALFRIEDWDATQDAEYRVRHAGGATYTGVVRRDPVEKDVIVAAAFTGNSPGPGGGKVSKQDVVDNVNKIDPDVLLFTGDQVYNHTQHTAHWLQFGETFGELMRSRPTVCIPDDHDVGQPNLWGGGGRKVDLDTKGGYTRPAEYVKLVEQQQTSHLPDPYDPTPIEQGIGVYYTSLNVGGIDFALIEDRKFKSGCFDLGIVEKGLGARPDHLETPDYDPQEFDIEGLQLLSERQERFLDAWSREWDGAVMKAVVSQTLFSMCSTRHAPGMATYYADFDANGWPQSPRNEAIRKMRMAGAFHICGDQHLGSITQYGVEEFRDAGYAFCVPSIASLYPRWWIREEPPVNPVDSPLEHTGDYYDGFGNRLTVYAHSNPRPSGREPAELHDRMPGFGVVEFNKPKREITMRCWPRMMDPTDPQSEQYAGWPRTIGQFDNLGRQKFWLASVKAEGAEDPVLQVIEDATGEVVYTVRILGDTFQPPVPRAGQYTVKFTDGEKQGSVTATATGRPNRMLLTVELE